MVHLPEPEGNPMRRGDRLFEIIEIMRRARGPISAEAIGDKL